MILLCAGTTAARERGDRWQAAERFTPAAAAKVPNLAVRFAWSDQGEFVWLIDESGAVPAVKVFNAVTHAQVAHAALPDLLDALATASKTEAKSTDFSVADVRIHDRGRALLVPHAGHYWSCRLREPACRADLESGIAPLPGDLVAPNRRNAVFRKGHDLWLRDLSNGDVRQLTRDGAHLNSYGKDADTSSELIVRIARNDPRPASLIAAWSPDSRHVLVNKLDESSIPASYITQATPGGGVGPRFHEFRFAYVAHDARASEHLFVIDVRTGDTARVTDHALRISAFSNLSWQLAGWSEDGSKVYYIECKEGEKHVALWQYDVRSRDRTKLMEESAATRVETRPSIVQRPNVRLLRNGDFIWYSDRDGWGHLYLYGPDGVFKNRITSGKWLARDILHVDEKAARVYILAGGLDPSEDPYFTQVVSVPLDGRGPLQYLSPEAGDHFVQTFSWREVESPRLFGFSPGGEHFIETRSSIVDPPKTYLRSVRTGKTTLLATAVIDDGVKASAPRRVGLVALDGATPIYGTVHLPAGFKRGRKYPLIDAIYAGPQTIIAPPVFAAANFSRAHSLAQLGFIVLELDARGTPFRSREFRDFSYGKGMNLAGVIEEHIAAIKQLAREWPEIDLDRVGIVGSSFGGYATARAMLTFPDFFRAGVSMVGDHDNRFHVPYVGEVWHGREPGQTYLDALENMAVTGVAERLRGDFLIVAAEVDDNVPLSSLMPLVRELIAADKQFEFLMVPNHGHAVSGETYVMHRMWEFFERTLGPGPR